MKKHEMYDLFARIIMYYPTFSADDDKVNAWYDIMSAMPFDEVLKNLKHHTASSKYPPVPADLVAPEKIYHDHMAQTGADVLERLEEFKKRAVGPTEAQRRRVRELSGLR